MSAPDAATPPSPLSLSPSAWFGSLTGCSLWILVLAGVLAGHDARVALLEVSLFALVAVAGSVLYATRAARPAIASYLLLLLLSGLAGLAALLGVDAAGLLPVLRAPLFGGGAPYAFLLVYPALAVVFALVHRRAARRVPRTAP
jgi:hypothetical protein